MQESNQEKKLLQTGTQLCGIVYGLVGVLVALSLIFLGFWKTLLIVVLFAVGYLLGACSNKRAFLEATINTVSRKDD